MSRVWWEFTPEEREHLRQIDARHVLLSCPFVNSVVRHVNKSTTRHAEAARSMRDDESWQWVPITTQHQGSCRIGDTVVECTETSGEIS